MSGLIEIFLIEDHPIFRDALVEAFYKKSTHKYVISGTAGTIGEAREKIKKSEADIILLDLKLPDESGVVFCAELKKKYPEKKVIALTGETENNMLLNTWLNKADAIIMKNSGIEEIISVIGEVLKGKRTLRSDIPLSFDSLNPLKDKNKPFLTAREGQVFELLMTGITKAEAAEKLFVSYETVNTHVKRMFSKFEVHNFTALRNKIEKYFKEQ